MEDVERPSKKSLVKGFRAAQLLNPCYGVLTHPEGSDEHGIYDQAIRG